MYLKRIIMKTNHTDERIFSAKNFLLDDKKLSNFLKICHKSNIYLNLKKNFCYFYLFCYFFITLFTFYKNFFFYYYYLHINGLEAL